ncbi:MAG: nuclear transport factor 2 family protein [Pyrinomonadaceae bacterium]|nr:nuclear transport factor 2 family protein [Pyrinomonadaceae bacterium]MBP6212158.1 nuclear transport factor 2 family protein [Pyrinomonadaceae bacterium]
MTNGEIIKGLYDDFATGNVPGVLGAFDANIAWTEAEGFMYGGTHNGPEGVLAGVFMRIGTEWEGFAAVPAKIVDGGDGNVAAFGTYSGKFLKTGKSVSVPFAHEWELRDGKVVKFNQHTDTLVIARDLGL